MNEPGHSVKAPAVEAPPPGAVGGLLKRLKKVLDPRKSVVNVQAVTFPEQLQQRRTARPLKDKFRLSAAAIEAARSREVSSRKERCVQYVRDLAQTAVATAPKRRNDWSLRLRLREDVLPQCALNLLITEQSVMLRFFSNDSHTHKVLEAGKAEMHAMLEAALGRNTEVEIHYEYFGRC